MVTVVGLGVSIIESVVVTETVVIISSFVVVVDVMPFVVVGFVVSGVVLPHAAKTSNSTIRTNGKKRNRFIKILLLNRYIIFTIAVILFFVKSNNYQHIDKENENND